MTRFCLVSEASVPEESVRLLREACAARGLPFEVVIAREFDYAPARRLQPGDLLYAAATSVAAGRVEQFLYTPGVATFHSTADGIYFSTNLQPLRAAAAGIPIPDTVYLASSEPALLRRQVERVGGFPVVLKVLGRSSGIGIMLAESMASLRSIADYAIALGHNPLLCRYIRDAVHWRVLVLGGQAIASYRNPREADDFRSYGSTAREDFEARPPPSVIDAAVRAVPLMGLQFAGVDVLEDPDGKAWFLEANFPCYYPHAQLYGGVDIAGRMVDFLLAKAGHQARTPAFRRLPCAAELFLCDDFLDEAEIAAALAEGAAAAASGSIGQRDFTGFSYEMPSSVPVAGAVRARLAAAFGFMDQAGHTLRFRRYTAGEFHPPHCDDYEIDGHRLLATAMIWLSDDFDGGETEFPQAGPALTLQPKRGRLAVWRNVRPDGQADTAAWHAGRPLTRGSKITLTAFFYGRCEWPLAFAAQLPAAAGLDPADALLLS